jgi:DNA-binding transcriptional regulator YdaS (Cro superfamily)
MEKIITDPIVKKEDAIKAAGSRAKLSRLLGISRQAVTEWGRTLPPLRARQVVDLFPHIKNSE